MKAEFKKIIVFAAIISLFTSTYAAFLNTLMKQGFLTDHFLVNWLSMIPKTYLFILPFVLIMGPVTRVLVEKIFRNEKRTS